MSWIQYFWKWVSVASPIPIRIIEVAILFLTIVGYAIKQIRPEWIGRMDKLAWQIPLGLLIGVFLISLAVSSFNLYKKQRDRIADLERQLDVARKQTYPPVASLMMSRYFKDLDIPLGDFGLVSQYLLDKTFDHCRIHGPIILFIKSGNTMTSCHLTGDPESIFIVTINQRIRGALSVQNCTFVNCMFDKIGFIGLQDQIDKLKTGFVVQK